MLQEKAQKTDEIVSPPQSNDQINQYDIIQLQMNEIKISIKETVEMIEYMNSLSNETEAKNEKLMKENETIIMEKKELIKQNEKLFSENRALIHENEIILNQK